MSHRAWKPHAAALLAYVALAVVFTWPLARHLDSHLTGAPAGDTGVYVWNQWVFRHEMLTEGQLPIRTGRILSLGPRADLSLHNYTTFANLLALPLIGPFGVIAAFNIVYLLLTVISGYAMFLLGRRLARGASWEAWLGGALFAWSPMLVARGTAHFSLVAAAPLPIFVLLMMNVQRTCDVRTALALGATVAWAAFSDVYYAVYCLIIAATLLVAPMVAAPRAHAETAPPDRRRRMITALDVMALCVAGLVVAIAVSKGWQLTFVGRAVRMRSLYTPVLVLSVLCLARVLIAHPPALLLPPRRQLLRMATLGVAAVAAASMLLAPVLLALGERIAEGEFDAPRIFWRSSPPGLDLASMLAPNPAHPLAPAAIEAFVGSRPNGYIENVGSISFVAVGILVLAWRRRRWRPRPRWVALGITFALLSAGPFVQVFGFNTHVPGPWALLRYVPLVGLARTPTRAWVVVMLVLAALFVSALYRLTSRSPHRRRLVLVTVTALLLFELAPLRQLHEVAIPPIYARVARDPRDVRVLELPFGVRDGRSSIGNFSALTQFYQTFHGKPLLGGYLSRISRKRVASVRRAPLLDAFVRLSEGVPLDDAARERAIAAGPRFVERASIGYVVVDTSTASRELRELAIAALRLRTVERSGPYELFVPDGVRSADDR